MKILINHIGYELNAPKKAILECSHLDFPPDFQVLNAETGVLLASGSASTSGKVPHWRDWTFYEFDFSTAQVEGPAFIRVLLDDTSVDSEIFNIQKGLLAENTTADLIHYFKAQRCSDQFEQADRQVPLLGTKQKLDLRGGWYDASGDVSKYLSHLSYANDMNPQQTPMVVWSLLRSSEHIQLEDSLNQAKTLERLQYEGIHGADFLARCVQDNGQMVMTVFDKWSKDPKQREACSYSTQLGHKHTTWQAGWRQGGGMTIAALARASRLEIAGAFTSSEYFQKALLAYQDLLERGLTYLANGRENLIDYYCGLLAATEMAQASVIYKDTSLDWENEMNKWTSLLIEAQVSDGPYPGHFKLYLEDEKPYFHAAEAGLPTLALMEAYEHISSPELKGQVRKCVEAALRFELNISSEGFNPFGYAKQYVQDEDSQTRASFFYPHTNPSGYWWQGENARLGSLSATAYRALQLFQDQDEELSLNLKYYAQRQLDWILGLNPFDICMLHGQGRNNPRYEAAYPPCAGGICNGITGGFEDELGIDFAPQEGPALEGDQKWRWGEQWIPHAAWYLLAISLQSSIYQEES